MCIAPIAQLDRAFDYESKGCGFDSCSAHHSFLFGMWHSLAARIVQDNEAAGSNPVIPTIFIRI